MRIKFSSSPLLHFFSQFSMLFLLLLFFACSNTPDPAPSQTPPAPPPPKPTQSVSATKDPLAPTSSTANALTGRLHTVTLSTTTLEAFKAFYVQGMGMTLEGPLAQNPSHRILQRKLWDIPEDINWQAYRLHRPSVPGSIEIRVLLLHNETPHIHESWSPRELGPFSLGFPNLDQMQLDTSLRAKGFDSMAEMQEGTIDRPDGSSYRYIESIYQAPDFLHAVGIERKDGMNQLGPVDSLTKKGGPSYSAQVLDNSEEFLAFLTEVLDLELRADRQWKTSPGSALGLEEGIPFRFSLVYAKGESHGHLLFIDYEDEAAIPLKVAPKVPNQGMGMWTFRTKNIEAIKKRAQTQGATIVYGPITYDDLVFGTCKVMTLLAPNGFLIEVFEQ